MPAKSWLFELVVAAAITVLAGCGFQSSLELALTFQPLGGEPLECDEAGVETVVVQLFDDPNDPPVTTVTQPCRAWRHQSLLVAPGPLPLRVQALNAAGALCYEDFREVTLGRRDDHTVEWVVIQHSGGVEAGCLYP